MSHIHEKIDFVVSAYIVHKNQVLLVHHRELNKWLPVGGHIELDEDSDQALVREVYEETGLEQSDIEFIENMADFERLNGKSLLCPQYLDIHGIKDSHQHLALIYFVKSSRDDVKLADKEHHDIRWFSYSDLESGDIMPGIRFYSRRALEMIGE